MLPDTLTIDAVKVIAPDLYATLQDRFSASYSTFVNRIHDDLEKAISSVEGLRSQYFKKSAGEDIITAGIINYLHGCGHGVSHDSYSNGHCDILITNQHGFKWIGEAKIHSSYDWITGGFSQLAARYSPGTVTSNYGGLLIYIKTKNAKSIFEKWKSILSKSDLDNFSLTSTSNPLRFDSEHDHVASGLKYHARHYAVVLHHTK